MLFLKKKIFFFRSITTLKPEFTIANKSKTFVVSKGLSFRENGAIISDVAEKNFKIFSNYLAFDNKEAVGLIFFLDFNLFKKPFNIEDFNLKSFLLDKLLKGFESDVDFLMFNDFFLNIELFDKTNLYNFFNKQGILVLIKFNKVVSIDKIKEPFLVFDGLCFIKNFVELWNFVFRLKVIGNSFTCMEIPSKKISQNINITTIPESNCCLTFFEKMPWQALAYKILLQTTTNISTELILNKIFEFLKRYFSMPELFNLFLFSNLNHKESLVDNYIFIIPNFKFNDQYDFDTKCTAFNLNIIHLIESLKFLKFKNLEVSINSGFDLISLGYVLTPCMTSQAIQYTNKDDQLFHLYNNIYLTQSLYLDWWTDNKFNYVLQKINGLV